MGNMRLCQQPMRSHQQQIRILIIGDSGVGKTTIIQNILGHKVEEPKLTTLGIQFHYQRQEDTKLTYIDTSGIQKYMGCIGPSIINSSDIILFVCSNIAKSVTQLFQWENHISMLIKESNKCQHRYLLINKSDLEFDYDVEEQLEQLVDGLGIEDHCIVSGKQDVNLQQKINKMIQFDANRRTKINSENKIEKSLYFPVVTEYRD